MNLITSYQKICQERVNALLEKLFIPPNQDLERIYQAMRYSVVLGGKRIRPLLVYGSCETLKGILQQADGAACAIELIHAYSLIHDDLPAMDNDDLRRGQPTTHKAFDEACAILAGDALQTMAFEILVDSQLNQQPSQIMLQMVQILAKAAGVQGMVGGQAIDLASVGEKLNQSQLAYMHKLKTGALIEASVTLGAVASGNATKEEILNLQHYAQAIGLAFQVQDDILDIESDTQTLGKTQGSDLAHDKPTYPALMGLEAAKRYVKELNEQAISYLSKFDHSADVLRDLAKYIVERRY